jgi:hypothetical protein
MKKLFLNALLVTMLFSLSSCNNLAAKPSTSFTSIEEIREEYEYEIINNKVKLLKYKGDYRTFIDIPDAIEGKKVVSIAKGCFVKDKNDVQAKKHIKMSADVDNEISDNSTYSIGDNVENIEDGAFEDNSTFVTNRKSKPNGWEESTMEGSGKDGTGNVYYDTSDEDTIVSKGIVYVKRKERGGVIVARCLTQRKEVEIPSTIDNDTVVDIGKGAFSENDKIEKVTIPSTIGEIYSKAFYHCSSLKEIICESTNLSRLMSYSFEGCTSLDVVHLPKRCTYLAPYSFADCGEISVMYIPFSVISIAENAFVNTTINKIVYGGTREQFEKINISADVLEMFNKAEIVYASSQEHAVLNRLNEINNYEDNTFVEFEGVITGFYNEKGVYVTDPVDGYSIWCFNSKGLPFYDAEYIGRKVKVSGNKIHYIGQLEISPSEIELIGEEKIDVKPIELDLCDPNIKIGDYLGYYVVVRGTVSEMLGRCIYLDGSSTYLYAFYLWPDSPTIHVGDVVETTGWVHVYNQVYEVLYDSRLIKVM